MTDEEKKKLVESGKQFSSEYQPSSEAKKEGWEKRRTRENLKKDLFDEFIGKPMKDATGKEVDTLEHGVILFKSVVFGVEYDSNGKEINPIPKKERAEMLLKVLDFLGIKESINTITGVEGARVTFYLPERNPISQEELDLDKELEQINQDNSNNETISADKPAEEQNT